MASSPGKTLTPNNLSATGVCPQFMFAMMSGEPPTGGTERKVTRSSTSANERDRPPNPEAVTYLLFIFF